ncbi:hypothetical protein [Ottowia sp.]|uniref:IS66 family transposase n=1 Tax=Ottowia sp. TaxID=1898956 RepID=UPI0025EDFE47|nr:hypothetical protein [Ottowia sp.]MBK6612730.1 transposase [Ottowia sp.]MBK6748145.1 transposase [Ottowia sp.]
MTSICSLTSAPISTSAWPSLKFKDTRIERITFELARLNAWRFGARTEATTAQQRQLFEETLAEDEASLRALLGEGNRASLSRAIIYGLRRWL